MKLEKIVKAGIVSAVMGTSSGAYAQAREATSEEVGKVFRINDNTINETPSRADPYSVIFVTEENKEDWYQQKKLINGAQATVLIQPAENKPGFCEYGLDGFPQKYDPPADDRTKDGRLEKSEMIPNLAEQNPKNRFYFPCDLKAEMPAPTIITVPGSTVEKEVPNGTFNVGAGYLNVFTAEDETYNFFGNMNGGSIFLAYQPRLSNWYFGAEALGYGNSSSTSVDLESSAADGPLAGQLVLKGRNDYSLETFGIGTSGIFGYQFKYVGLELHNGIMHDWTTQKFTESSAQYINGTIVEGTDISNHSDNTETKFYGYTELGLRIKLPYVCITPTFGLRTDFSEVYPLGGASAGYCPNQE